MSYSSAIDQLNAMTPELHTQTGQPRRKFSLAEIGILLQALGNPHHRFRSVLIAGTNGKGSTAATLASILRESGLRTGLYTSPHLTRPNERIRINGDEIPDDAFASVYFRVHDCAQRLVAANQRGTGAPTDRSLSVGYKLGQLPSFFEHLTAMAFLYFADRQIDFAVLEVGLGGRLDATNIVDPLISVITDISLDHTEWLGPTIAAIAREKAGILRPGGTLVTLPQHPEANQVIGEVATALNVRAISAVPYMPPTAAEADQDTYRIPALGADIEIASPLHGAHQHRNIALAIATAIELGLHHGVPITPEAIATGIRNTRWPGRLEIIQTGAPVLGPRGQVHVRGVEWLLDVAHNPAGAWALRASLSNLERHSPAAKPSVLIFSCLRDKPVAELAQILFPLFDRVIFAPISSPRATPMPDLLAAAAATGTPATAAASIAEALTLAEHHALTDVILSESPGAPCLPKLETWESDAPNAAALRSASTSPNQGAPFMRPPLSHEWESTTQSTSESRETSPAPHPGSPSAGPRRWGGRVVLSGSVYLVGEARPLLLARAAKIPEKVPA